MISGPTTGEHFAAREAAFPLVGMQYSEDFDSGPAGWWHWKSNFEGLKALETTQSAVISRSPWWVDYNHAPPGAGYLHMLFCLNTKGPFGEAYTEIAGRNSFVTGRFPRNFTDARLTFRLKGELLPRGANLVLLFQGTVGSLTSGWILTGQPLQVSDQWTEQTVQVTRDPAHWLCLGGRHNRTDYYGRIDMNTILRDVNCNIMLILYPLTIKPMGEIGGDPHLLRPGHDYPIWTSFLPEGYVMMDRVDIAFPPTAVEAPGGHDGNGGR